MTRINRRNALIGTAVTSLFATAGISLWPSGSGAQAQELTVDEVLFDPANPVLGNKEGNITIVEFFDYQCPYCKANHPILTDLVETDGNIRLVMKDWPIFGAPSITASQLALGAASLGQYEIANEALMETEGRLSNELIRDALVKAGLNVAALQNGYRNARDKWDGLMTRNSRQAAQLGLQGTPAFIIGTTIYPGSLDAGALRDAVERGRA
ncbi:DsbA family protein [Roseovarius arcticus]|uniref:DsbA family protein n=1 Tax=Roseovarius arcticus TaxID=2547404 RepID=UPI00111074BB|nr:DsbA family protein [Roseovarius arcticus]